MKALVYKYIDQLYYWKRHFVNPEKVIRRVFRERMGKELNLENPQTYSEKLQWMKLYNHDPLYTTLVDKYAVKQYVEEKIGKDYLIPTLGVWSRFDDIDFDELPEQFVLKCTHDSGGLVICKEKSKLNIAAAREIINKCLKHNFYYSGFEWPYKNVKPRIIAEQYMEDSKTMELRDYKFFCFDGKVKFLFIATERQKEGEDVKFDFFDADFNHLPFRQGHENATVLPEMPLRFEEMKVLAAKLSAGMPHVRIDLYEVDGKVYFGEFTFFHHGGWTRFEPEEWDYTFGKEIELPNKRK